MNIHVARGNAVLEQLERIGPNNAKNMELRTCAVCGYFYFLKTPPMDIETESVRACCSGTCHNRYTGAAK